MSQHIYINVHDISTLEIAPWFMPHSHVFICGSAFLFVAPCSTISASDTKREVRRIISFKSTTIIMMNWTDCDARNSFRVTMLTYTLSNGTIFSIRTFHLLMSWMMMRNKGDRLKRQSLLEGLLRKWFSFWMQTIRHFNRIIMSLINEWIMFMF